MIIFISSYSLVPPPVIVKQPQPLVNANVGETVMLQCEAVSYGNTDSLKYHWFKVVDGDKKVSINHTNSSKFVINHVTTEDDSISYQCAVTNENGTTFSKITKINSKTYYMYVS